MLWLRKRWRLIAGIIVLIVIVAAAGFVIWANSTPEPLPTALAALESDAAVTVTTDPWLTFTPADAAPTVGYVFYPGGRVDPRSYAPMAHELAARGYLTVIPPMPLNLAVFAINAADPVIAAHPEIAQWAVGGHSLGGSMAARYVSTHADQVSGLVLVSSYPDIDLSDLALAVSVIYGSNDGLATVAKVEATRDLLPSATTWVEIAGGNHAQMGWYGAQSGDNEASISREDQQAQMIDATANLLGQLGS